jgi:hypothetical protein
MNTVLPSLESGENRPKNLAAAYKEVSGGGVLKPFHFEGAGDASLSPSHVHRHTPALSLGAVCDTQAPAGLLIIHSETHRHRNTLVGSPNSLTRKQSNPDWFIWLQAPESLIIRIEKNFSQHCQDPPQQAQNHSCDGCYSSLWR